MTAGIAPSARIRSRLALCLGGVLIPFAITTSLTLWNLSSVEADTQRLVSQHVPLGVAGLSMAADVNDSMSALRGWMLTGDANAKSQRVAAWRRIEARAAAMAAMTAQDADAVDRWAKVQALLPDFRAAQDNVEAVARSPKEQPAITILTNEATPAVALMGQQMSAMMDEEGRLPATPARKELLRQMAEFRGPLGLASAQMRAYLLTGDPGLKKSFETYAARAKVGFSYLSSHRDLMTTTQLTAWSAVQGAWAQFEPLPERLFAIRDSEDWNMAQKMMLKEVGPRASALHELLVGDGTQSMAGGLVGATVEKLRTTVSNLSTRLLAFKTVTWILLFAGLGASGWAIVMGVRTIARPIQVLTKATESLAAGDYHARIEVGSRTDEIGAMAVAVEYFRQMLLEKSHHEARIQETEQKARAEQAQVLEDLRKEFEQSIGRTVAQLTSAVREMRANASVMADAAKQTQHQAERGSGAAGETSANVSNVAGAAEQLAASIKEIARNSAQSARSAGAAVEQAQRTRHVVGALDQAVARVGEVVLLISNIAGQTNLLALNATIEAARAGEMGKGFAVVAGEVKGLANQTRLATGDIEIQVRDIQAAAADARHAIQEIAESIEGVGAFTASISAAVEQQEATTSEIVRSVLLASEGTQDVNLVIDGVRRGADATGDAAAQVLAASERLLDGFTTLERDLGMFLTRIKAA